MRLRSLAIETTNACSLKCEYCWGRDQTRKQGYMAWELFTKIVEEAQQLGITSVGLHYNGESTLHPRFADMIRFASGRGFVLNYSTNGVLPVSDEIIDATMAGDVAKVNFSIHVDDDRPLETARRYRAARGSRRHPRLTASWIYRGQPEALIDEYRHKWYEAVDIFGLTGEIDDMKWSRLPPGGAVTDHRAHCAFPMRYASVLWDGSVTVCCHDLEGKLASGNVNERSLRETIHEPHFVQLRDENVKHGHPQQPICFACGMWEEKHRFPSLIKPEQLLKKRAG